jgi:hypothetical protein
MAMNTAETAPTPAMCQRSWLAPKFRGESRILGQLEKAVNRR